MRPSDFSIPAAVLMAALTAACADHPAAPTLDTGVLEDRQLGGISAVETRVRGLLVTGPAGVAGPHVKVFDGATTDPLSSFFAYTPSFTGGVRVAVGDVDGDGLADVVTGSGPGGAPHVKVFSGADGSELASFFAYAASFTGGVFVAAGDVDGDGRADIVTGGGSGGGPHVKVFSGADRSELASFFAYAADFMGGVRVATGDVDGDGRADVVTGAGPGAAPHVKAFSAADLSELASFFAYAADFSGGVHVAAGDVDGDGRADIVTGAGAGGGPHVRVFNAADLSELASFFAYDAGFTGGVHVAAADVDGDGRDDLVTGPGADAGPHVKVFSGSDLSVLASFFAYDPGFTGGVYVGAGHDGPPPPTADDVVAAAEESAESGALSGMGQGASANGRLGAWLDMLREAARLFAQGDVEAGCRQLEDAYLRADGASPPPDFVDGPAREELAAMILDAWEAEGCSEA